MDQLDEFLRQLKMENISDIERSRIITKMGDLGDQRAVDILYKMFHDEDTDKYDRGGIAMALGELRANIIVPDIIAYLKKEEYLGSRAEFLCALFDLDCVAYYLLFVEILCDSDWETMMMADTLVSENAIIITDTQRTESLNILNKYSVLCELEITRKVNIKENSRRLDYMNRAHDLLLYGNSE